MMYSILYRIPEDKITTLVETDSFTEAVFLLQGVVINTVSELIDFSPELDGVLDETLAGVRLADAVPAVA